MGAVAHKIYEQWQAVLEVTMRSAATTNRHPFLLTSTYVVPPTKHACAPATCGELVQGTLHGKDFLINSPIDLYAEVTVQPKAGNGVHATSCGTYTKLEKAIALSLSSNSTVSLGAEISIRSQIPREKGMASSTSELAAGVAATLQSLGMESDPKSITDIIVQIESTDNVHFPGIVDCNPLTGEVYQHLGAPPPIGFVIVDSGGSVSTAQFDRELARKTNQKFQKQLSTARQLVHQGFRYHCSQWIGQAATLSAQINQHILKKPLLEPLLNATKRLGAIGVNCAHTGTVLGVMYDYQNTPIEALIAQIRKVAGENSIVGVHRLTSGGIHESLH